VIEATPAPPGPKGVGTITDPRFPEEHQEQQSGTTCGQNGLSGLHGHNLNINTSVNYYFLGGADLVKKNHKKNPPIPSMMMNPTAEKIATGSVKRSFQSSKMASNLYIRK
jgi:hypothetical protein